MKTGILTTPGSGLNTMHATGQLGRVTRHFQAYRDAGHALTYFSSLPDDRAWISDVRRPKKVLGFRGALTRPYWDSGLMECDVLRVTNLAGSLTAITTHAAFGTPFVVSHGADYEAIARIHGRPAWKWRWLRRLAFALCSAVIVPNPVQAADLQRRFPRTRVVHVPNWVDTQLFRPERGAPASGRRKVLYIGRLVKEKNLERLAEVCATHNWKLICVGAGPLNRELWHRKAECHGAIPWESLPLYHGWANVFCLPSFTEGHPKALLEAMSSGVPCAVSTGVTGLVTPGVDGLVFAPYDEPMMAKAIASVEPEHGRMARLTAERYDIKRVMPQEIGLVREVAR